MTEPKESCCDTPDCCVQVKPTDKGVVISVQADDPEKAAALKRMIRVQCCCCAPEPGKPAGEPDKPDQEPEKPTGKCC
jgi:hypothetical protein